MLSILKMQIKPEDIKNFNLQKSCLLRGVLMEQLDPDYAARLHEPVLHPYSQDLIQEKGSYIWEVKSLNKEAFEHIIKPINSDSFISFTLTHNDSKVEITAKELKTISKQSLIDEFYMDTAQNYIKIDFLTPTAFKQNGSYLFYPDLKCIYQSLMKKYSTFSEDESMEESQVLEQLIEYSQIVRYHLRSTVYYMEGVKIPSFVGSIVIKNAGGRTMNNLGYLLFRFGEFAGVGIKCSIGMGAIRIDRRNSYDR